MQEAAPLVAMRAFTTRRRGVAAPGRAGPGAHGGEAPAIIGGKPSGNPALIGLAPGLTRPVSGAIARALRQAQALADRPAAAIAPGVGRIRRRAVLPRGGPLPRRDPP
jgi:hypothetical protein